MDPYGFLTPEGFELRVEVLGLIGLRVEGLRFPEVPAGHHAAHLSPCCRG